jgi:hypothetical protein
MFQFITHSYALKLHRSNQTHSYAVDDVSLSLQSVGYGDVPLSQGGTHIAVGIYTFLSTILLAFAISNLTDVYKERKRLAKILAIAERKQTLDRLKDLDAGDGVARDTFVLAVLEQLGILNRENDIEPWIKVCALQRRVHSDLGGDRVRLACLRCVAGRTVIVRPTAHSIRGSCWLTLYFECLVWLRWNELVANELFCISLFSYYRNSNSST